MDNKLKKKPAVPKVVRSQYYIKVNGEFISSDDLSTLAQANEVVRSLKLNDTVKEVQIVRQTVTETLIRSFRPEATVSLVPTSEMEW